MTLYWFPCSVAEFLWINESASLKIWLDAAKSIRVRSILRRRPSLLHPEPGNRPTGETEVVSRKFHTNATIMRLFDHLGLGPPTHLWRLRLVSYFASFRNLFKECRTARKSNGARSGDLPCFPNAVLNGWHPTWQRPLLRLPHKHRPKTLAVFYVAEQNS